MKNSLRGQLGPRGLLFWFVSVILLAGFMPTLSQQVSSTLSQLSSGSMEYFMWSIFPFLFVLVVAIAFLYLNTPQPREYQ